MIAASLAAPLSAPIANSRAASPGGGGALHPALRGAPLSLRESLERIVEYGRKRRFLRYGYRDGERRCPIGMFLTDAQIDYLAALPSTVASEGTAASDPICWVAEAVGEDNIEAMTGMTVKQAIAIQWVNDNDGQGVLVKQIREVLAGRRTHIFDAEFDLD